MTVTRASGDRIRLTTRSGRFFSQSPPRSGEGPTLRDRFYAISGSMVPQIPYAAIGIGIAVLLGIWAFLVAETIKQRTVIAGFAVLIFLFGALLRSMTGQVISLAGWVVYGIGCLIFLRLNGVGIR